MSGVYIYMRIYIYILYLDGIATDSPEVVNATKVTIQANRVIC